MPVFLVVAFEWLMGALVWLGSSLGGWLMVGLGYFFTQAALPLVRKVLVGLGFGWVVYSGIDAGLQEIYESLQDYVAMLPGYIIEVMAWFEVDRMISLILSAYAMAAAFKSATLAGIFHR